MSIRSAANLLLFLCISLILNVSRGHEEEKSKRILVNDQDVVATRLANLERETQELRALTSRLQQELSVEKSRNNIVHNYGSTYIRWGRKQCNGVNTELIYSGFATGQHYLIDDKHFGGPANMLCLPNNPEISNRTAPGSSYLYGTEFERDFFGKGAVNEDVPCALCRSINTTTSVMIPGRTSCYSGWKAEYNGIVAAGHFKFTASTYICVDGNPEYLQSGKANEDGHLLYATSTKCGSLPCPPYVDNRSLNCVVCSK